MLMGVDVELLDQIDQLVKLCPCGAEPREGSAYCSDDCVPNHIGAHTDRRQAGPLATPMRWRPDMVSEVDDSGLHDLGSSTFYDGPFHARLFQHGEPVNGAVTWHLRLDDGYRFVGANLTGVRDIDGDLKRRVADKWAALERQLTSSRHVVPDTDPWADVAGQWARLTTPQPRMPEDVRNVMCAWLKANGIDPLDVPMSADIHIGPTTIRLPVAVRDDAGALQLDPGDRRTLLVEDREFPLLDRVIPREVAEADCVHFDGELAAASRTLTTA
jgi:hypothetical protein